MRSIFTILTFLIVQTASAGQTAGRVSAIDASDNDNVRVEFDNGQKVDFQATSGKLAIFAVLQTALLSGLQVTVITTPEGNISAASISK
ncbi:MAG: hypothetical protein ACXVA9_11935 [Bdellovibrionales bacterium]